jgi:hypothetical protein
MRPEIAITFLDEHTEYYSIKCGWKYASYPNRLLIYVGSNHAEGRLEFPLQNISHIEIKPTGRLSIKQLNEQSLPVDAGPFLGATANRKLRSWDSKQPDPALRDYAETLFKMSEVED